MKTQQLRYLVAVFDAGSMSAAARSLHVSQPVISRSIRDFEREHKIDVFRLSGRRLVPTDAGRAVIESARRALCAMEAVAETARESIDQVELAVATTPTNGALLGLTLEELSSQVPNVSVRVCRAEETADVARMIEEGTAELGFGVTSKLAHYPSLTVTPLGEVEVVLVSPTNTNLPDPVSWEELGDVPLVIPPLASEWRQDIEESIRVKSHCPPRASLVSEDRTCWTTAAQAGIGSFLSYRPVVEGIAGVEIRRFAQSDVTAVGFAHRRAPLSPNAARLIGLAQSSRLFSTTLSEIHGAST